MPRRKKIILPAPNPKNEGELPYGLKRFHLGSEADMLEPKNLASFIEFEGKSTAVVRIHFTEKQMMRYLTHAKKKKNLLTKNPDAVKVGRKRHLLQ